VIGMVNIWKIMWLFIVVITTFLIISIYGPALGNAMDAALRQNADYAAGEIAGIITLVGAGPDGLQHVYELPRLDKQNCLQIYRTYVSIDMQGRATAEIAAGTTVNLTTLENADSQKGDAAAAAEWDSLKISCLRNELKQLVVMRKGGQVRFVMQYASA